MTPEKLLEACETLNWLSQRLNEMNSSEEAVSLAAICLSARTICLDLARHKPGGNDHADALDTTLRGAIERPTTPLKTIAAKYLG